MGAAVETSAVDTSLSGPKEVNIFPASVPLGSFFIHITYDGGQAKKKLYLTTAAGFRETLLEKLRSLGSCSSCKTTRVISITDIYGYIIEYNIFP